MVLQYSYFLWSQAYWQMIRSFPVKTHCSSCVRGVHEQNMDSNRGLKTNPGSIWPTRPADRKQTIDTAMADDAPHTAPNHHLVIRSFYINSPQRLLRIRNNQPEVTQHPRSKKAVTLAITAFVFCLYSSVRPDFRGWTLCASPAWETSEQPITHRSCSQ